MRTSASLPEHGDGITLADLARAGWGGGAPLFLIWPPTKMVK